jgi:hypothetical protein
LRAIVERRGARAQNLMQEHIYFAGQFLRDNWKRVYEASGRTEEADEEKAASSRASWPEARDAAD